MSSSSSSSFTGRGKRRIMYTTSLVIMLMIMLLLQAGGAIRIFPSANDQTEATTKQNQSNKKSYKAGDLVHNKYLGNGRGAFGFNRSDKGSFAENKRRVPSCPDPLHN